MVAAEQQHGGGGKLAEHYEAMAKMRQMLDTMRANQALRGEAGLARRTAERAQRDTWRQMSGVKLLAHEINHPGNKPFAIGFVVASSMFLYGYFSSRNSPEAQAQSKYYQRFLAPKDH